MRKSKSRLELPWRWEITLPILAQSVVTCAKEGAKANGVTMKGIAAEIGWSYSKIKRAFSGKSELGIEEALKLAYAVSGMIEVEKDESKGDIEYE